TATSTFGGSIVLNGATIEDVEGTGLSLAGGTLNVSGLTTSEFATTSISQWNNDSGFLTAAITSLNGLSGASQTFTTTTASDTFTIGSSGTTHTLTIPS